MAIMLRCGPWAGRQTLSTASRVRGLSWRMLGKGHCVLWRGLRQQAALRAQAGSVVREVIMAAVSRYRAAQGGISCTGAHCTLPVCSHDGSSGATAAPHLCCPCMQDWAIRTMARNCSDQWRRSMAAHLGTLAQPRFVQDPPREADRLLASRAAQLDAAIPPPGEAGVQAVLLMQGGI